MESLSTNDDNSTVVGAHSRRTRPPCTCSFPRKPTITKRMICSPARNSSETSNELSVDDWWSTERDSIFNLRSQRRTSYPFTFVIHSLCASLALILFFCFLLKENWWWFGLECSGYRCVSLRAAWGSKKQFFWSSEFCFESINSK